MSDPTGPLARWRDSASLTLCCGSVVLAAVVFVVGGPDGPPEPEPATPAVRPTPAGRLPAPGVRAEVFAGDVRIERALPTPAFCVEPGTALDARLPSGPFQARLEIGFDPRWTRHAAFGVEFAGGSVILEVEGRMALAEEAPAGTASRVSFTDTLPVSRPLTRLKVFFDSTGDRPARLRVLWRPEGDRVAHPVPAESPAWTDDEVVAGEALVQVLQCAACHPSSDPVRQARLSIHRAPDLGQAGTRLRPEWVRSWLAGPTAARPGTAMPELGTTADQIEDLTHWLASLGGPVAPVEPPAAELLATGRLAYERSGCVACHGPDGSTGEPLAGLAAKWSAPALASFLRDPSTSRPRGRMPSLSLTDLEAKAIAAHLLATSGPTPPGAAAFATDPARVERGRRAFVEARCVACHDLGSTEPPPGWSTPGPPLESLGRGKGCLDPAATGVPRYDLSSPQRARLAAYLGSLGARRSEVSPIDRLAGDLLRLGCVSCHAYAGAGGPPAGIDAYFRPAGEGDLGDEGRLPPALTDVGARLTSHWLAEVVEREGRIRPHLATRMPRYPAGVETIGR